MARIWDPAQWLFDMYLDAERTFDRIHHVTFYMDEKLPSFTYNMDEFSEFFNNLYGFITTFKSKRIQRIEFVYHDGTTKEFLQPAE